MTVPDRPLPEGQKMWGGRFDRAPDASFYEFERSWHFDRRMLPQELALDRAWARAITAAGILTSDEGQRIVAALDEIEARAKSDAAWYSSCQPGKPRPASPGCPFAFLLRTGPRLLRGHPISTCNCMRTNWDTILTASARYS